MHPNDERLQRLIDGELSPEDAASAHAHLATCSVCRGRVADAEREEAVVSALLSAVDDPAPALEAEAVAALASAPESPRHGRAGAEGTIGRTRMPRHRARWVAVAVALVAAGAAYAIPGSPIRGWVDTAVRWIDDRTAARRASPDGHGEDAPIAGIQVAPGDALLVLFRTPQPEGRLRVTLTGGGEVGVRAPEGAATFTADEGRLVVDNRGAPARFEIEIPRFAPRVEIRVGRARVFSKEGSRIEAAGTRDGSGAYVISLAPAEP